MSIKRLHASEVGGVAIAWQVLVHTVALLPDHRGLYKLLLLHLDASVVPNRVLLHLDQFVAITVTEAAASSPTSTFNGADARRALGDLLRIIEQAIILHLAAPTAIGGLPG